MTVARSRAISARASASSACSGDTPGRPGRTDSAVNAPSLAVRHTATTVDRSTPYFSAACRWVACPVSSDTHSSYFCDGANTLRRLPVDDFDTL